MKKIIKSESEWKKLLNEEEFWVTRKKGTEKPFHSSQIEKSKNGLFKCKCCNTLLFNSSTKFDSGSGWPSFWEPSADDNVETEEDHSAGMVRTEVHCNKCQAHLGHVFPDGPQPTGLRYCINSVSLDLKPSDEE